MRESLMKLSLFQKKRYFYLRKETKMYTNMKLLKFIKLPNRNFVLNIKTHAMNAFSAFPKTLMLISFAMILSYACNNSETYKRFGVSFKCPKGQNITEKAVPLYGDKPSKEAGSIWIKSDPSTNPAILISWLPCKKKDYRLIAKLMGVNIKARKPNHDVYIEKIMRELKLVNHRLLLQRFCTQGREGSLLNVNTGWFCEKTNRIFQIDVSAPWKDPTLVVHSLGNPIPDWPRLEKDPSYLAFQKIAESFNCHDVIK